ncbi:MAG: plasmid pRiA4b ORF-3 family protein, partial [Prevotellaceae bacterium]|nr:plasmid pRiA4b ORF-3 family protein [Prevotellaceae bacterium]
MIYSFIIGIENNKNFMREYHVPSEYSLYDFKRFIASELDFDDSQQSVFFLLDRDGKKIESYSLFDTGHGAMDTVTLEDLNGKEMKSLLYTFDFFNDRSLLIEFLGEAEKLPRIYYPFVAQSKGKPPGQFFEVFEDELPEVDDDDDDDDDD